MKTINLYKEKGVTSFQAIDKLRKVIGIKKCGHTGTLDPMAEGVLPVCVGKATKMSNYLMNGKKIYIAELKLGITTDTFDITGEIIVENSDIRPSEKEILDNMKYFKGKTELVIPAFSAVKIKGKRAYELARKGLIENAGRRINNIFSVELIEYNYPYCIIQIECDKGTYVRSIIHEMGLKLGCGATMSGLIRTQSGKFKIAESYKLDEINRMMKDHNKSFFKPVWDYLDWPEAVIKNDFLEKLLNGVSPKVENYKYILGSDNNMYMIKNDKNEVLAIAEKSEYHKVPLKIIKVFK